MDGGGNSLAVTGNVTSATWIPVLKPRAANIVVLLVYLKRHVLEETFGFVCKLKTRCTSANADYADRAFGVDWFFRDGVIAEVLSIPFVLV